MSVRIPDPGVPLMQEDKAVVEKLNSKSDSISAYHAELAHKTGRVRNTESIA